MANPFDALAALRDTLPDAPETETAPATPAPTRESLTVQMERRRGKPATIICGWQCSQDELLQTAAEIKRQLGCGGSARGGEMLIQGDRRADVSALLRAMGHKVRP